MTDGEKNDADAEAYREMFAWVAKAPGARFVEVRPVIRSYGWPLPDDVLSSQVDGVGCYFEVEVGIKSADSSEVLISSEILARRVSVAWRKALADLQATLA